MRAIITAIKYFYREPEEVLHGIAATFLFIVGIAMVITATWGLCRLLIYIVAGASNE